MEDYEKPDWKQWIPIYGAYRMRQDVLEDRPSLCDKDNPLLFWGSALYHSTAMYACHMGAAYGLAEIIERLS